MGFFDSKWIVTYEYSDGFLSRYKTSTLEVDASSEYDAKSTAKKVLTHQHKYLKILKAEKARR